MELFVTDVTLRISKEKGSNVTTQNALILVDLCESCFNTEGFEHKHNEFVELEDADQIHRRVTCDACGRFGLVGSRYKCMDCPDFDLCQKCIPSARETHILGHWFNRYSASVKVAPRVFLTSGKGETPVSTFLTQESVFEQQSAVSYSKTDSINTADSTLADKVVQPVVVLHDETTTIGGAFAGSFRMAALSSEAFWRQEDSGEQQQVVAAAAETDRFAATSDASLARNGSNTQWFRLSEEASSAFWNPAVEENTSFVEEASSSSSSLSAPLSWASVASKKLSAFENVSGAERDDRDSALPTISTTVTTTATLPGSFPPAATASSSSVSSSRSDDYALQQVSLFEMGFINSDRNIELLLKHKGDLVQVCEDIVEMMNKNKYKTVEEEEELEDQSSVTDGGFEVDYQRGWRSSM
ncbi:hypothetical protein HK100_012272 [Physocladia obscura]|uniref:ZZ-type domain-containing protein n=1 Tax=Physocladia obscura TaxID=109957 RepID=A0AAD5XDF1_9FUNG|nr:hypothetical protein HK100_012272 [Physocladia obscura]